MQRWQSNLLGGVCTILMLGALFVAVHGKDESEKPAKKKGDMTAYYKRTAAKFIAETAKKPGDFYTCPQPITVDCAEFPHF